jgi:hypothetical protein
VRNEADAQALIQGRAAIFHDVHGNQRRVIVPRRPSLGTTRLAVRTDENQHLLVNLNQKIEHAG